MCNFLGNSNTIQVAVVILILFLADNCFNVIVDDAETSKSLSPIIYMNFAGMVSSICSFTHTINSPQFHGIENETATIHI